MNFCRRILMAPGSLHHHLKKVVTAPPPWTGIQNYRIWKVACSSPAAAPFSAGVETSEVSSSEDDLGDDLCEDASSSAERAKVLNRETFHKLRRLTVETIDLIIREEEKKGVYVTQEDLLDGRSFLLSTVNLKTASRSCGGWRVRR
ncbi:PREDICTED: uncharacterized protein LOC104769450 [Camelina sativa]|uniref:Uncharacterized protein LOC104769450 n=1 Tax=Camelina sativa TaxID=90675 RepID=A0ABM0XWE1_CAMSA|nr:PREDICTED: uncharacterized protein LOC104769450 [Camelina sativa]